MLLRAPYTWDDCFKIYVLLRTLQQSTLLGMKCFISKDFTFVAKKFLDEKFCP